MTSNRWLRRAASGATSHLYTKPVEARRCENQRSTGGCHVGHEKPNESASAPGAWSSAPKGKKAPRVDHDEPRYRWPMLTFRLLRALAGTAGLVVALNCNDFDTTHHAAARGTTGEEVFTIARFGGISIPGSRDLRRRPASSRRCSSPYGFGLHALMLLPLTPLQS